MTEVKEDDAFFLWEAKLILNNFLLNDEEKTAIMKEWAKEVFEIDIEIYRNDEKVILEGRSRALSALQTICTEYIMKEYGVKRA